MTIKISGPSLIVRKGKGGDQKGMGRINGNMSETKHFVTFVFEGGLTFITYAFSLFFSPFLPLLIYFSDHKVLCPKENSLIGTNRCGEMYINC